MQSCTHFFHLVCVLEDRLSLDRTAEKWRAPNPNVQLVSTVCQLPDSLPPKRYADTLFPAENWFGGQTTDEIHKGDRQGAETNPTCCD